MSAATAAPHGFACLITTAAGSSPSVCTNRHAASQPVAQRTLSSQLGLSNFSAETFPWCRARYDVFEQFDDIVLSGEVGIAKPHPAIYRLVCERSGIEPSEAVFLDDSPTNVAGAHAVGMPAFLFTDVDRARADLRSVGLAV